MQGKPPVPPASRERRTAVMVAALGALLASSLLTSTFPYILGPIGITMLSAALIRFGWNTEFRRFSANTRKTQAVQVLALLVIFFASGGARYGYGSQDTLRVSLAIPGEETFEFGSNESYMVWVTLYNDGVVPLRLFPDARVIFRDPNGSMILPTIRCPIPSVAYGSTDSGSVEIGADRVYVIPILLQSNWTKVRDTCHEWNLSSIFSGTFSVVVQSYDRAMTLPTWRGPLESESYRVAVRQG